MTAKIEQGRFWLENVYEVNVMKFTQYIYLLTGFLVRNVLEAYSSSKELIKSGLILLVRKRRPVLSRELSSLPVDVPAKIDKGNDFNKGKV